MNVEILEKVKAHVLEEPARINMWGWLRRKLIARGHAQVVVKAIDKFIADNPT